MNNKKKTKRLTISLLCCGRAETTERCLKSLMPIREAVDSELQVVDTGCQPETRAVVDKYADEVFEFEWCNDFAKARNFQLDQANGEMFLFIDDDEFFLDTKEIIKFFNRPDCVKYNIGGYNQRNYLNFDGVEWQDTVVVRMCKVTPQTYFVGKVHEYIEPAFGNAMFMDAYAGHYGYVYHDEEENIRHSQRNVPLLEEMMVEMPEEYRWPYQLCQELGAIKDFERVERVSKENVEKTEGATDFETMRYRSSFMASLARAYDTLGKKEELYALYEKSMADKSSNQVSKARVASYAAHQYFVDENWDMVKKTCNFYIKIYDKYAEDSSEMFLQGGINLDDTFDATHQSAIYCYLMTAGMVNDDFGPVTHYYRRIPWNSPVVRINVGMVRATVMSAVDHGYKKELNQLLEKFFCKKGLAQALLNELRRAAEAADYDQLDNMVQAFRESSRREDITQFLAIKRLEKEMAAKEDWSSFREIKQAIIGYTDQVNNWNEVHMKGWNTKDEFELSTPPEILLTRKLLDFVAYCDVEPKRAMESLKAGLRVVPPMDTTIAVLSKMYGNWHKIMAAKANNPEKFAEMAGLEQAIMAQVAEMRKAGQEQEADAMMAQLEQILEQTFGVKSLQL